MMRFFALCISATMSSAALADESTEWLATVLPEMRAAIETTTDPAEFGRLRARIFKEARFGPCDVTKDCYRDVLALDELWKGRRVAVAKANKGCARYADALVTRDFDRLIGAPVECVYIGEGLPKDVNRTTTANGVRDQLVFGRYLYVYSHNGTITAVQH